MDTPHSFAERLKIATVDQDGIYWHANGAASYIWLAHPISAEHLGGMARHKIADVLGNAMAGFAQMPGSATLQFIYMAVPNIDWAVDNYLRNGNSTHRWLRQYELAKAKAFKSWTKSMQDAVDVSVNAKDIMVLITLTVYAYEDKAANQVIADMRDAVAKIKQQEREASKGKMLLPVLKGLAAHERTEEAVLGMRTTILTKARSLEKAFKAARLPFSRCPKSAFIRFVASQVDPVEGPTMGIRDDPEMYLSEQICRKRIETEGRGKYMKCGDTWQSMLSVETWPRDTYAGILSLNNGALEDHLSPLDLLKSGSVVCVNCRVVEKSTALAWTERRLKLVSKGSTDHVEDREVVEDVNAIHEWIKNLSRALVDVSITVKVSGSSQYECDESANEAKSIFQNLGFTLRIEETETETLWSEQLPGGFLGDAEDGGMRTRRRRDILAAAVAPIYMSGRGTQKYAHMCFNEHYEPYAFNNFENPRSYNIAVLGESGSGKSGRIQDIITDLARLDASKFFILDYGGSFTSTVNLFDDEGVDVALTKEYMDPYNVFAGPAEITIPMLKQWLPNLVLPEGAEIGQQLAVKVEKALRRAYYARLHRSQPYREFEDIPNRYPGQFPSNARKRFAIEYLDQALHQEILSMLKGDEVTRPRFEVYVKIRLVSFRSQHGNEMDVRTVHHIDKTKLEQLQDNFRYIEEDEHGVYVLTADPRSTVMLHTDGWVCDIDKSQMILEAQRFEDYKIVVERGAKIIHETAWLDAKADRIRQDLAKRYGANHGQIERLVRQDLERIDLEEYFNGIDGRVDMQEEIKFSDFIRAARDINDDELNEFIGLMGSWYGEGQYAKVFDRPGGIDLRKYRCVNWDFKPLIGDGQIDRRFIKALFGAVMMRIHVYCNDVTTLRERKCVVIDELKELSRTVPQVPVFVDTITLQARKNNYCVIAGTQKFDHLEEFKLIDSFQHYFIGAQLPKSILKLKEKLEFTEEMMFIVSNACMEPGRYADFVLYIPAFGICEIVRSVQTGFEYWIRTTSNTTEANERDYRQAKVLKYQRDHGMKLAEATIKAAQECAKEYPRGMRVAKRVEIN